MRRWIIIVLWVLTGLFLIQSFSYNPGTELYFAAFLLSIILGISALTLEILGILKIIRIESKNTKKS